MIGNDPRIKATRLAIRETQRLLDQLCLTEHQTRQSLEKMRIDLKRLEQECPPIYLKKATEEG